MDPRTEREDGGGWGQKEKGTEEGGREGGREEMGACVWCHGQGKREGGREGGRAYLVSVQACDTLDGLTTAPRDILLREK